MRRTGKDTRPFMSDGKMPRHVTRALAEMVRHVCKGDEDRGHKGDHERLCMLAAAAVREYDELIDMCRRTL